MAAGTSSSTRKPRKSSPQPSKPRFRPAGPPSRRADARILPPPTASPCSDGAATRLILDVEMTPCMVLEDVWI